MRPIPNPKARMCLNFQRSGLDVYANREALIDLREQLTWLIESPAEDYYHCHVLMSLENDESRFEGKRPRNAGVKFSDDARDMVDADFANGEVVDLSFFPVSDADLDDIQKDQK